MAKSPAKKMGSMDSSKGGKVTSNKKSSDKHGAKKKAPKVKAVEKVSGDDSIPTTPPCDCEACNPCAGIGETGTTGLVWCNGAQELSVLVFPGGDKVVGWNANGPYWKNP